MESDPKTDFKPLEICVPLHREILIGKQRWVTYKIAEPIVRYSRPPLQLALCPLDSGTSTWKESDMSHNSKFDKSIMAVLGTLLSLLLVLTAAPAKSHCDSEKGPIIPLIRQSLESGEITPLLKWLPAEDEPEIRELYARVRALRAQSSEAKDIADQLFIETFIRLHRAGEGEPFDGIKAADAVPPVFGELDAALKSGSVDPIADDMTHAVREKIGTLYDRAHELSKHQDESVEAGREYVEAYVAYMHFVEGLEAYLSAGPAAHQSARGSHGH